MPRRVMERIAKLSIALMACSNVATALAQTAAQRAQCERIYSPTSGQKGKDVVWVPTPNHLVTAMLKMAGVTSKDVVYDLGAGDGKVAIAPLRSSAHVLWHRVQQNFIPFADCLVKAWVVGSSEGDLRRHLRNGLQRGNRRVDVLAAH